jgi:hypothetical protein
MRIKVHNNGASYIKGIPNNQIVDETASAIETCYPHPHKKENTEKTVITLYNIFAEIIRHPLKYPGYTTITSERRRKCVVSLICINELNYQRYSHGNTSKKAAGAMIRDE